MISLGRVACSPPSLRLAEDEGTNSLRLVLNLLDRQSNTPMSSDVIQVKLVSCLYFDGANQAASDMIERGGGEVVGCVRNG
jgi:hypothetical protein